jgi:hypothetical protein
MTSARRSLRRSARAHICLLALSGGVLLLASGSGVAVTAGGVALVYLSGIAFVASLFRRIRETERRWSPRPSSARGLRLYRLKASASRRPEEGLVWGTPRAGIVMCVDVSSRAVVALPLWPPSPYAAHAARYSGGARWASRVGRPDRAKVSV